MTQISTEQFARMIMQDILHAMRAAAPAASGATPEKLAFHEHVLNECEAALPALVRATVEGLLAKDVRVSDRIV